MYSDKKEQAWVWRPQGAELYLDHGDRIRFRVDSVEFNDHTPATAPNSSIPVDEADREAPYVINVGAVRFFSLY